MNQMAKLVAIHQPNFFPWLGYFGKLVQCDAFVFLDNVQIPRTGAGSWVNRVHLLVNGQEQWLTLPINRLSGQLQAINEVQIAADDRWRRKILDTVRNSYRKAPFFSQIFPVLEPLFKSEETNLAEFNMTAIVAIAEQMGISKDKFTRSSALPISDCLSTDRLVRIVQYIGGAAYLYGGAANAANGYQENDKFLAAGLLPVAQNFQHPVYSQFNMTTFRPGLSIIDGLMNIGFAGVHQMLLTGIQKTA